MNDYLDKIEDAMSIKGLYLLYKTITARSLNTIKERRTKIGIGLNKRIQEKHDGKALIAGSTVRSKYLSDNNIKIHIKNDPEIIKFYREMETDFKNPKSFVKAKINEFKRLVCNDVGNIKMNEILEDIKNRKYISKTKKSNLVRKKESQTNFRCEIKKKSFQ